MTQRHRTWGRGIGLLATVLVMTTVVGSVRTAYAENFFDFLFGGFRRLVPAPPPDTTDRPPPPERTESGPGTAFCVRLCDGFNFPIARHVNATPVELCHAMCPASRTMIFEGSVIEEASSAEGTRYGDLPNAFAYRQHLLPQCTCNGKDTFGLAAIDPASDPTLQPGDVVATASGLMAYTPIRSHRGDAGALNFTPIDRYSGISGELRHHLATVSVAPNR
jgi:hypothetical protein